MKLVVVVDLEKMVPFSNFFAKEANLSLSPGPMGAAILIEITLFLTQLDHLQCLLLTRNLSGNRSQ